jgi:hypothetical protein
MDETLRKLIEQVPRLPDAECAKIAELIADNGERTQRLYARLAELQAVLDDLRLQAKYMAFDLEATRRENAVLRVRLQPPGV